MPIATTTQNKILHRSQIIDLQNTIFCSTTFTLEFKLVRKMIKTFTFLTNRHPLKWCSFKNLYK